MSKVLLGSISSEGEILLNKYLNKFMSDADIEPLKAAGIKGKMKNHARRPEVVLVIIDETLYDMCKGVAEDVLSLPKVHKYVDDDGLREFLEKKFGVLEAGSREVVVNDSSTVTEVDEDFNNLLVSDAEDTSNDSDKDNMIQKLNDELIMRDTMIRNLEAQIEEKSSGSEVSHFISRIKVLEEDLQEAKSELSKIQNESYVDLGKVKRAEQVISSVDDLKASLNVEKEKCLRLEREKSDLEKRINVKESELEVLRVSNRDLESKSKDSEDLRDELEKLKTDYDAKIKEISTLNDSNADLENRVLKLTSQVAEIGVLNEKIESLSKENKRLKDTDFTLSNTRVEFESLKVDYDNVVSELSSLKENYNQCNDSKESVLAEKAFLESEVSRLKKESEEVSVQLNKLSKNLLSKDDEIDSLSSELGVKSSEVTRLYEENKQLSGSLKDISDKLSMKDSEIDKLTLEVISLSSKVSETNGVLSDLEAVNGLVEDLKKQMSDLELELTAKSEDITDKDTQIESLNSTISSKNLILSQKDDELLQKNGRISELELDVSKLKLEVNSLDTENKKLTNEIGVLRQSSLSSEELLKASNSLEDKVTEYKRKNIRLESENNSLKEEVEKLRGTSNKDVEIASLRSEVSDYKSKLRKLQGDSGEISQLRERCANLEIALVEKDDQLRLSEGNVFNKMSSIALPKTMFNISLDVPDDLTNMYVFASGSSESNLITYQTLKRVCSSISKSILIVDLVTDSYIDREFGVERIGSPVEFLQGTGSVMDCISKSKLGNTSIISTAFNYINSLYFLNVDWKTVLTSFRNLADIVIINVGCLNETVSKVLFNAFSSVMQSHIIIKASPINLRTALLTLTGIPSAKTSKVSCIGFENSSKGMYQRLAQKFNTQILKDSDVLKL